MTERLRKYPKVIYNMNAKYPKVIYNMNAFWEKTGCHKP